MQLTQAKKKAFNHSLLDWYQANERPLPWKESRDPYKIWLSEIILQQTRVAQGTPYYLKFIQLFPTVQALASASEDDVLKAWEGLGYYSRARNLHATAQHIAESLDGIFPNTYEGLLKLKGIGPYTAAAIASFAYGLPHAVLDGNVFRVLARYFGESEPIDGSTGKKVFQKMANGLIDSHEPDHWNQAIMNLGAMVCSPQNPICETCPIADNCVAFTEGRIAEFPIKEKAKARRHRHFHYLVLELDGATYIEKRIQKDIWKGLYQFPLLERKEGIIPEEAEDWSIELGKHIGTLVAGKQFEQLLTHQKIHGYFHHLRLKESPVMVPNNWVKVQLNALNTYAFPKIIHNFIIQSIL